MVPIRGPRPVEYDIDLATRQGNYIPNTQGSNVTVGLIKLFLDMYREQCPRAIPQIVDGMYNCVGMVFAARRTTIEVRHTRWILEQDGYRRLLDDEAHMLNDVVLYTDEEHDLTHIGIITEYKSHSGKKGEFEVWVRSKWGTPGAEYLHPIDHVPEFYGKPTEYWRHSGHYEPQKSLI